MKHKTPLDPEVVGIDIVSDNNYTKNRATVKLDVSDGDGGRKEMKVSYPIQNDKHLIMLMKDDETGKDVNHPDKHLILDVINKLITKKVD